MQAERAFQGQTQAKKLSGRIGENAENLSRHMKSLATESGDIAHAQNFARQRQREIEEAAASRLHRSEAHRAEEINKIVPKGNRAVAEEVGEDLEKAIENARSALQKHRAKEAAPYYENLKNIKKPMGEEVVPVFNTLSKEIETARPGNDAILSHISKLLAQDTVGIKKLSESNLETILPNISNILKQGAGGSNTLTPSKFNKVRQVVIDEIESASRSNDLGAKSLKRSLINVKNEMDSAFNSVVPEFANPNAAYTKLSHPITEIENKHALGKILQEKQQGYATRKVMQPADIPKMFHEGHHSPLNARHLLKTIGNDHRAVQNLKDYTRNKFADAVIADNGEVSLIKLKKWIQSNPGAFTLDPSLRGALSSLRGSQEKAMHFKEQAKTAIERSGYEKAFEKLVGGNVDAERVASNILGAPNSREIMEQAIALTDTDTTGKAIKGLQHGIATHILEKAGLASMTPGGNNILSYDKVRKIVERSHAPLKELYGEEGFETIEKVLQALSSRNRVTTAGAGINSQTAEKLHTLSDLIGAGVSDGIIKEITKKTPGLKILYGAFVEHGRNAKLRIIDEVLSDPKKAKLLLTPLSKMGLPRGQLNSIFHAVKTGVHGEKE
jgi:hypothetical protein